MIAIHFVVIRDIEAHIEFVAYLNFFIFFLSETILFLLHPFFT